MTTVALVLQRSFVEYSDSEHQQIVEKLAAAIGFSEVTGQRQKTEDGYVCLSLTLPDPQVSQLFKLASSGSVAGYTITALDFSNANLQQVILIKAQLHGANLCGANLSRSVLNEADFSQAQLGGTNFTAAYMRWANLNKADLSKAIVVRANLGSVNLRQANLTGADLSGLSLHEADLGEATLRDANCRGADLTGTNLCGVDLTGAALNGAGLHGAEYNEQTQWPENFAPPSHAKKVRTVS